jgi:hypothetical protein
MADTFYWWMFKKYIAARGAWLGYPHSCSSIFILYKEYYVSVIKILYSILVPSALIFLYISYSIPTTKNGPTCHLLRILSKYIHVRSSFEEFIATNLMVQSKFNLDL